MHTAPRISDSDSTAISLLRLPLAMAVVAGHAFVAVPVVVKGVSYNCAEYPLISWLINFVAAFVSEFSVPAFFFISGYLFFVGGFDITIYRTKLKRRVKSLLLPYVAWNILAVAFVALMYLPALASLLPSFAGRHFSMTAAEFLKGFVVGNDYTSNPYAGNLWYVRELMTMVLISPLLSLAIDKAKGCFIACLWALWAWAFIAGTTIYFEYITTALLFFSSGALFANKQISPLAVFKKYWKPALLLLLALCTLDLVFRPHTRLVCRIAEVFSIPCAVCVMFAAIDAWGRSTLRRRIFGTKAAGDAAPGISFFIFAAHGIFMWNFRVLAFWLVRPATDLGYIGTYLVLYFGMLLFLTALYYLLGKLSPTTLKLLTARA